MIHAWARRFREGAGFVAVVDPIGVIDELGRHVLDARVALASIAGG
jgi:hypothetical protein